MHIRVKLFDYVKSFFMVSSLKARNIVLNYVNIDVNATNYKSFIIVSSLKSMHNNIFQYVIIKINATNYSKSSNIVSSLQSVYGIEFY